MMPTLFRVFLVVACHTQRSTIAHIILQLRVILARLDVVRMCRCYSLAVSQALLA